MNYYYDIILNWNENIPYNFYEWNDYDYLELIKKIPLIKIKHKTLVDIWSNNIKINKEFLNNIKDKTLVSGKNSICKIDYACLFTDNKNVIAIEFNETGESINRSKLLIDDEMNVLEVAYSLKEVELEYEIIEKLEENKDLRQENEVKKLISLEIKSLYENKELSKLRYLFYEYKGQKSEDIDEIYNALNEELKSNFNKDFFRIYDIIKLSYHKV